MRGHTGDELLRLPVRARGIRLGRAVDRRRVPLDGIVLPVRSHARGG